jgi:membrane protein implicated in regulation of membrane protease activity
LWVAVRCIVEALRNDVYSLSISIAYLIFLICRGWSVAKDKNAHFNDLILFPPTLLWATWAAYRGVDLFMWWLPAVLLVVFLASSQLVASLLSISVMLISITLSLKSPPTSTLDVIVATIAVVSMTAVYRMARDRADDAFGLQKRKMELVRDAARLLHAEVNGQGELLSGSAWLLQEVGLSSTGETLHLYDLIHPSDHIAVTQTIRNAIDMAAIRFTANTNCDCRLLRHDGSAFWVHAQFVRTSCETPSVVVSFISIDDRLRADWLSTIYAHLSKV